MQSVWYIIVPAVLAVTFVIAAVILAVRISREQRQSALPRVKRQREVMVQLRCATVECIGRLSARPSGAIAPRAFHRDASVKAAVAELVFDARTTWDVVVRAITLTAPSQSHILCAPTTTHVICAPIEENEAFMGTLVSTRRPDPFRVLLPTSKSRCLVVELGPIVV